MLIDIQLMDFNRRTSKALGIITQTSVTSGGNTVLFYFMVIEDLLDFNMLLKCDYVYVMKFIVPTLFHVHCR